ncbi:MAG: fumarylacetoacetate hydrolase family protein [Gaiellaceae bacterium]
MTRVVRVRHRDAARAARVVDGDTAEILDHDDALAALRGEGAVVETLPVADLPLLPPVDAPEIWCAGVTYERSRDARLEEAATDARDVYALVYDAERPELFLKDAAMRRTVGPGGTIRTRSDASWSVPEPELGVVIGDGGEPVAVTAGNDVSSRDIEGANPLYIPQAKIFAGACAIGPSLVVPADWDAPWRIALRIADADGRELFAGETSTAKMRRTPRELVRWLVRDNPVPAGSVLLTGTGLVPDGDYTLMPGHRVEVTIDGIGTLVNTVGGER